MKRLKLDVKKLLAEAKVAREAATETLESNSGAKAASSTTKAKSIPELLTGEGYKNNRRQYRRAYGEAKRRFKEEYVGPNENMKFVLGLSNPRGGGVPGNLSTADDFFGHMEEVAREVGGGNIYRRSSVDASNPRLQEAMGDGFSFNTSGGLSATERPGVDAGTAQGRVGIVDVLSSKAAFNAIEENEKRQAMVLREAFGETAEGVEDNELRQLAIEQVMGSESAFIKNILGGSENISENQKFKLRKAEADMLDQRLGMTYENEAGEIVQNPYAAANVRSALELEEYQMGPRALGYSPEVSPSGSNIDTRPTTYKIRSDTAPQASKRNTASEITASEIMENAVNRYREESLGFVGRYAPQDQAAMVESSVPGLGSIEAGGAMGMFQTAMLGGAIGGALSVATGGEFGEGTVAGGIAGLGIRGVTGAIRANGAGLERAMYRSVLGEVSTEGMTQAERVAALRGTKDDSLGFVQSQAKSMLLSDRPSMTQQSRGAIMGGAALSGMMFTSNKKDRRRGFNKHRGNRI